MKIKKKIIIASIALIVLMAALYFIFFGPNGGDKKPDLSVSGNVIVSDDGRKIVFPAGSEGLNRIKSEQISTADQLVQVLAPSRIVATVSSSPDGKETIVLFDSPDLTGLYSQFRQSKINLSLAQKNLARVKEMYESNSATEKDFTQAQSDEANARATFAEMEGRFKAYGFNADEIAETPPGMVWLISDVTEIQLRDVDKGEDVDVYLDAFPEKKLNGKAVAVGDVVDPVTRTIKVRVSMPNHGLNLYPGMFARIDYGDPRKAVLSVPFASIITVEGKDYVFVQTADNEFVRRNVMLSEPSGSRIIVLSGIKNNERIVSEGTMLLKGLSFKY
jgi:multidrug efflux pump subunit AcrA (membrane-fusion protein)